MLTEMTQLLYDNKDFFLKLSGEHVAIAAVSVLIAVLAGGALGIFISEYRGTSKAVLGIINFLYTIPSISMLGFLIPLSGIGNTTAVIALSLYALLPMVRNTYTGPVSYTHLDVYKRQISDCRLSNVRRRQEGLKQAMRWKWISTAVRFTTAPKAPSSRDSHSRNLCRS